MAKTTFARNFLIILGIILVYVVVNFEFGVGTTFFALLTWAWLILITDKRVDFPIIRKPIKWGQSVLWALGAYGVLMLISFLLNVSLVEQKAALFSQITPALAGNLILTFLTWVILIPAVETIAILGKGFEWLTEFLRLKSYNLKNPRLWFAMIIIGGVFMLFHLTALGVTAALALLTVFFFGMISVFLVVKTRNLLAAILFHILANGIAVFSAGGFSQFQLTTFWWIIIGMIGFFFIISREKIRRRIPFIGS